MFGNANVLHQRWLAGCMGFLWVTGFSFFHCVASPFHSFVTSCIISLPLHELLRPKQPVPAGNVLRSLEVHIAAADDNDSTAFNWLQKSEREKPQLSSPLGTPQPRVNLHMTSSCIALFSSC